MAQILGSDWHPWETMRADEVRTVLAPGVRGSWQYGTACVGSWIYQPHDVEEPHFYYCRSCLAGIREWLTPVKPHPVRDLGLCVRCKGPSALKRTTAPGRGLTACVATEREGTTIARTMVELSLHPSRSPKLQPSLLA